MTSPLPPALYIGHSREQTIVSTHPLRVRNGGARAQQWGRVVEITPAPGVAAAFFTPAGFTMARKLLVVSVLLFVLSAGIAVFGTPLALLPAAAATVTLIMSGHFEGRQRKPGTIHVPDAGSWVLVGHDERATLWDGLQVGKRICGTLPALAGMVDTVAAERLLAAAISDLAQVLAKRQEVRALQAELARPGNHGLPAESPALRKLTERRDRVRRALSDIDADVARKMAGLRATDAAGLNFLREAEIHRVTARVDQTLADLALPDLPGGPDSGLELADEVQAILAVYRELNERYG